MNPRALKNNGELFEYLVRLGEKLQKCQSRELAELINNAGRFAVGSASEFMHEAELALERVKKESPKGLTGGDLRDADAVLAQIKEAFRKIGGA